MSRMIFFRIVRGILTVLIVSFIMFTLLFLVGDPVAMIHSEGSPEELERLRQHMGLDDPFIVQYSRWFSNALKGDFGLSFYHRSPVMPLIRERIPVTMILIGSALLFAILVSFPAGIICAVRKNSVFDQAITGFVLLGQSMPVFWTGIVLMLIFSVNLGWLPPSGWGTWQQAILPILTLGAYQTPLFLRMIRSSMLEVLGLDYIRTARAKGLRQSIVIFKHAFKNASIPIISIFGVQFALLMAGAVITETVFAIPGLGRLMVRSIIHVDQTVVLGATFFIVLVIVFTNLAVDFLYIYLDPRIRYD